MLLYKKIYEDYKLKILEGKLVKGDQLPTEAELSKDYNVSRITSKRALEELRSKGYIERIQGSGSFVAYDQAVKSNQEVKNIKFVLPLANIHTGFMHLLRGISDALAELNIQLDIINYEAGKGIRSIKKSELAKCDGLILFPISDRDDLAIINELYLENISIVTVDKHYDFLPISYVVSDNETGGTIAVDHLIDKGHNRIAFVTHGAIENISSIRERYFGYCKALKTIDSLNTELIYLDVTKGSNIYDAKIYQSIVTDLISKKATSVFAVNDKIASYVMRAAHEIGVQVPVQLSVVGFDNDESIAEHLICPLTSVSQNYYDMGIAAAHMLIRQIKQPALYQEKKYEVQMVIRESVKQRK